MNPNKLTIKVANLSPRATEKDVYEFFAFSGPIEHIEIMRSRSGNYASTAYVTFKEACSLETALLLNGAIILNQRVCISQCGERENISDSGRTFSWKSEDDDGSTSSQENCGSETEQSESFSRKVIQSMLSTGYILGKGALNKAKEFDESHQVSANAMAKVAEVSEKIGLTDKISCGFDTVQAIDERYHVLDATKSIVSGTGRVTAATANYIVHSRYFSAAAVLVSDALRKVSNASADLAKHGSKQ